MTAAHSFRPTVITNPTTADAEAGDFAGALDMLLASPGVGTVRRFAPGKPAARMTGNLLRNPRVLGHRARELGAELGPVATGASTLKPSPTDKRFSDVAWQDNAVLRRVLQSYIAAARVAEALVDDADLDWRDAERMRFLVTNLMQAAAPSNNPLINPEAWKAFITAAAATPSAASATCCPICAVRRACPRWSTATRSRSAATLRPRPAQSCSVPRSSS
jgi:polyhydroxyalkanoate synthase